MNPKAKKLLEVWRASNESITLPCEFQVRRVNLGWKRFTYLSGRAVTCCACSRCAIDYDNVSFAVITEEREEEIDHLIKDFTITFLSEDDAIYFMLGKRNGMVERWHSMSHGRTPKGMKLSLERYVPDRV